LSGASVSAQDVKIPPELVDRMIEVYCDWRTGCGEVQAAYKWFAAASSADRGAAFAAYTAALDREQAACESYAEQVLLIQARFARAETTPAARTWTSRVRRVIARLGRVWAGLDHAERRLFEVRTGIPVLAPRQRLGSRPAVAELDALQDRRSGG
jgi:hypothetical protein